MRKPIKDISGEPIETLDVAGRGALPIQTLSQRSMFWRPTYSERSAWHEHVPFAFWLIEAHQPRVLVELGTHYGVSYFAFCQAVEKLGLGTRCFAVDTWKGDVHAGFYDEDVFQKVQACNDAHYSGFSRLVRSEFDSALKYFTDGSVDLLHIDGCHSYEAVVHDLENWLPKLSDRAVVIMHDTNVRERDFGVLKCFEELKVKYPYFEFIHGHGLGVLGVGGDQRDLLKRLLATTGNDQAVRAVQDVFSRLGRSCADAFQANHRQEQISRLDAELGAQKKKVETLIVELEKAKKESENRSSAQKKPWPV